MDRTLKASVFLVGRGTWQISDKELLVR